MDKEKQKKILFIGIGVAVVLAIALAIILLNKGKSTSETPSTPTASPSVKDAKSLEDISIVGHQCVNSKCSVLIGDTENSVEYAYEGKNKELFLKLGEYSDYLKVNVSYVESGQNKTIVDYKIIVKSTKEDISSVTTEAELREKLGLFSLGSHSETLTLKEIGNEGFGAIGDETYTYISYTFEDSNSVVYEMKYKNPDTSLKLVEGTKYKVTFEVVEGSFGYEYEISKIEKI